MLGEFTATGLDGEEVDQSIFTGYDVTMVNVWATFCGPCLSEMPDLGALHQEFSDQKFQVVGIVTDVVDWNGEVLSSQIDLARQIVEETGASYLHLLPSEDLQSLLLWQVNSVPTTIFVDENGSLVGSGYLGRRDAGAWRAIIQEKLAAVQGEETP
ncbi:MAG: TlpA family protein disulfide reductase [Angelakisella sp.]|nr:TlpA family protein disulfide reductase [Angelakisella sp.]